MGWSSSSCGSDYPGIHHYICSFNAYIGIPIGAQVIPHFILGIEHLDQMIYGDEWLVQHKGGKFVSVTHETFSGSIQGQEGRE